MNSMKRFYGPGPWFSNINADIIFGIPYQTMDDWLETISRVLSCRIPHVSCYSLTVEEGTRFGRLKQEGIWPEPEEDLEREMYRAAIEAFGEAGFEQYEISNMAKPQYRCRHNMNYWLRGEYLGFGVAAHSFSTRRDSPILTSGCTWKRERGNAALSEYYHISNEEALSESMILGLRLTEGVDLDQLSSVYRTDVRKKYGKSWRILPTGSLLSSTICGKIDKKRHGFRQPGIC